MTALASLIGALAVQAASLPTMTCRLETGRKVPCGETLGDLAKHPAAVARYAIASGHDYDPERRLLRLECQSSPTRVCYFRVE